MKSVTLEAPSRANESAADRMIKLHSGDVDDKDVILKTSSLPKKQKLAFYADADYCFVTKAEMLPILRLELDSLIREGGVYYSVFDKKASPSS